MSDLHKNFAEHVVAAACDSFRDELAHNLRARLRVEMEQEIEHIIREVTATVHCTMVSRYDLERMRHELGQHVTINGVKQ